MKRKRLVAKLLALSLTLSGLPMTSVYAAELPVPAETEAPEDVESPAEDDQAAEVSGDEETAPKEDEAEAPEEGDSLDQEKDETEEPQKDAAEEQVNEEPAKKEKETAAMQQIDGVLMQEGGSETEAYFGIPEDAKMAGSDGILYDNVAYLSARNVMAMDEEMQELYQSLCDDIAYAKTEGMDIENVVFAVNADGDLYCNYFVPGVVLEEIKSDLLSGANEVLTPAVEEEKKDDETIVDDKEAVEDEKKGDETAEDDKEAVEDEKKDDETAVDDKETAEDEKKDDETAVDDKETAENEKKDDETVVDDKDAVEDEKKDDEAAVDDKDAVEKEEKEDELIESEEIPEEELVLFAENMDILPDMEEETFEEIESVRIENTLDLGYGSLASDGNGADGIAYAAVLPSGDYFTKQLNAKQKQYYNTAKGKLIAGNNTFVFQDSLQATSAVTMNVAHALSALILTYPDKTDWMAKPGGFSWRGVYRIGSGRANYTVTVQKSNYYSSALESEAQAKIQTVGSQAVQNAANKSAPVYEIIKYFDQWICEHGYYEMAGTDTSRKDDVYYYCHSCYGMLLKGYGVCESYAKAMSRLLDAVGIPNVYVVGDTPGGGHAWNYVQMPNGKWYLLDSTWNDTTNPAHTNSSKEYLLVKNDGMHLPTGLGYTVEKPNFTFPKLDEVSYVSTSGADSLTLSATVLNLSPKGTKKLTFTIGGGNAYKKMAGAWSSSDTKVAKVDKNGKVTAVAPGVATISYTKAGMVANCAVYVDQIKSVKIKETQKTSETLSLGSNSEKEITLVVDMGASPHTLAWMIEQGRATQPKITYSKKNVAEASAAIAGNEIKVKLKVGQTGKTDVKIAFGGKTVKLTVSAGELITGDMFDIDWTAAGVDEKKTAVYTGKAVKPKITKKADPAYKPVTFKVSYVNNKNAGSAKVVVSGTGKYGGMIEYPFTITPIDITGADFSKALKNKAYNGGANPPKTEVKLGKKKLKAGTDYDILYNGAANTGTIPVGTYTISIRGKGNYTGTVGKTQSYQVTQNTIAKVKVSGSSSVKYTGMSVNPYTVKIGSNVLPASDYTITWYHGQGALKQQMKNGELPIVKGKYTAVITVKGSNLTTTATKKEITKKLTIK